MESFTYQQDTLYCEEVALADIAARVGTPCYVYSSRSITEKYRAYDEALAGLPHEICYAVKANSNLSVLRLLAARGAAFDIVSGGELFRVTQAGGDPSRVVFSGVGKTADEIEYALSEGIHTFNCESEAELSLLDSLAARRGVKVRIAVRVNPDVNAETHPYISTGLREHKFGIDIGVVEEVYERARQMPSLIPEGVSCHIGSQLMDHGPLLDAVDIMIALVERLRRRGFSIRHLDLGGGLGIRYEPGDEPPEIRKFIHDLHAKLEGADLTVMVEPGRSIVGEAGVLLCRVLYRKQTGKKKFVVVDASMTELIRPALYQSHHEIIPVRRLPALGTVVADVVGPVCESADFLARGREVANVLPGDLLAVCSAGAYGFVQSSNYNSRPRPAEMLVEGREFRVIRERESFADLTKGE